MNRLTMLVTQEGQWVLPGSSEFLDALGDPEPDYDAEAFAVKNLGFIKFSMIERSIIEVELHPRNVSLAAVLGVQQQIQSSNVKLFRIKYFDGSWQSEITSSAEQAMVRLSRLTAPEFVATSRERFIVEPQDYTQLLRDEDNTFRVMAQKWRMSFGQFDSGLIPFALNHQLLRHMMIVGVKPQPADPVFRFIGDAHSNWAGSRYHFTALGDKLVNFPDKDYGSWVAEYYKSVANTGEPRYDHVTASIQRQATPYVTHYERLMLPWTTGTDEILVTMLSRRLAAKSEFESPKYVGSESPLELNSAKSA
ncbi:MAG TPA: hypothetical protein VNF04_17755 [Stellaceae bacterium]|nr:hypothetical protein [Stellaceae bacterium]